MYKLYTNLFTFAKIYTQKRFFCKSFCFVIIGIHAIVFLNIDDEVEDENNVESAPDDYDSSSDEFCSGTELDSSTDDESSESDDSEDEYITNHNEPLYPGAPITVAESILSILTLTSRFKVTGVLLSAILSIIRLHCIRPNHCVKTLYKFKNLLSKIELPLIRHLYCSVCLSKLERPFCSKCNQNSSINYFLEISIIAQLESFFKRPGFLEKLNYRFTRTKQNDSHFEDIYDGSVYKSLPGNFTSNPNNITFSWNSDGLSLFNSSKFNVWPVYFMINELPYQERIKKENNIIAGLWFGNSKPSANLFISAFEKDLTRLYQGLNFDVPNKPTTIKIRGLICCGSCDLPAKALFLNIQQFNGKYGCPHCEIQTRKIENVQVYPYVENLTLRTTASTIEYAKQAVILKKPVFGVKGPSFLNFIVYNFINAMAIDQMHCVYQGMMKKLMTLWFDTKHRNHPASLFPYINLIDATIKKISPPSFVNRSPRTVSDYKYWKAYELKSFLLVYCLPVLDNIMSTSYFEHLKLFIYGITLLSSSSVSREMIETARRVLTEFVIQFEHLYGAKYMTCNLHLLLHLADDVLKFGPLWVSSCFPFENFNGMLAGFVHGSKNPELQISTAITYLFFSSEMKDKYIKQQSYSYNFCQKIMKSGTHRRKLKKINDNVYVVGKDTKVARLNDDITDMFNDNQIIINYNKLHEYKKLLKNTVYYEIDTLAQYKKSNSSCIKFIHNDKIRFGLIKKFIRVCDCECSFPCEDCNHNCKNYATVNTCIVNLAYHCNFDNNYIPTVHLCQKTDNLVLIEIHNIVNICYFVCNEENMYIIEILNDADSES